jgi:hypothetical protein
VPVQELLLLLLSQLRLQAWTLSSSQLEFWASAVPLRELLQLASWGWQRALSHPLAQTGSAEAAKEWLILMPVQALLEVGFNV